MVNDNGDIVNQKRDILQEIAEKTRQRVARDMAQTPLEVMKAQALAMDKGDFPFEKALKKPGMSFICEVKKASPSKGLIAPDFPYLQIAQDYEAAGASAISCLTEPDYFQGQDRYLQEIVASVSIPVLRKDFFVNPYMIYQAKVLGASAILLICAILDDAQLQEYFDIANQLGLSSIFEAHDEAEVLRALRCGARIIGVNNRNLKTFALDVKNSVVLRGLVPTETLFISESGIKTRADIALLESCQVNAVLIGETLMRSETKKKALDTLRGLPKVKICGLSRPEDILAVNALDVDYVGFVFAKSRREITPEQALSLKVQLNPHIQTVGVFVNAGLALIEGFLSGGVMDIVQLHGQENNAYIQELKKFYPNTQVWKAVNVTPGVDFTQWPDADCFLLDNGAGGTGTPFDWALLPTLSIPKPYFIAGGLSPENVAQVLPFAPYGVDVSGGVETEGKKDPAKLKEFMKKVNEVRYD